MISAHVNSPWTGVISSTLLSFRRRSIKKRTLFNKKTPVMFESIIPLNISRRLVNAVFDIDFDGEDKGRYFTSRSNNSHKLDDTAEGEIDLKLLAEDQRKAATVSKEYDVMVINVSGEIFVIPRNKVNKWPTTLLGSADFEKHFLPDLNMYFIDRNRMAFEHIIRFYQTDQLVYFPVDFDRKMMKMELDFYKIGWRDINKVLKSYQFEYISDAEKRYALLNDHRSSSYAMAYMLVELVFLTYSIIFFLFEEDPVFLDWKYSFPVLNRITYVLNYLCMVFFTCDFIVRGVVSLDTKQYFKDLTTWLDIFALFPFYSGLVVDIIESQVDGAINTLDILQMLKIFRIARIFKIIRRSERLRIILKILRDCMSELSILLIVWSIGVIMAGSVVYFCETDIAELLLNDKNERFYSVLESAWWAQITMGAIGYGDIAPIFYPGMTMTTIIIFGSTIITAIPMTFIIRRFSVEYEKISRRDRPQEVMGSFELTGLSTNSKEFEEEILNRKLGEILEGNSVYKTVVDFRRRNITLSLNSGNSTPSLASKENRSLFEE